MDHTRLQSTICEFLTTIILSFLKKEEDFVFNVMFRQALSLLINQNHEELTHPERY